MENKEHLLMAVSYKLFTVQNGERQLSEQTSEEHPFVFITGFQTALDGFEDNVSKVPAGENFNFTLTPEEAFGPYDPDGVHVLPCDTFNVKGHFDKQNVYVGAVIALQNEQGQQFNAQVKKVEPSGVTLDTNHPLAGQTLCFEGKVIENRPATEAEIDQLLKQLMSVSEDGEHQCCGHCHHEEGNQCCHHEDGADHHCHHGEGHHCCHHNND